MSFNNVLSLISERAANFGRPSNAAAIFSGAGGVAAAVIVLLSTAYIISGRKDDDIPVHGSWPVVGAWNFYTDAERFCREGFEKYGDKFVFYIRGYKVLAVSSAEDSETFFGHKGLSLGEGAVALRQSIATVRNINVDTDKGFQAKWFSKSIISCVRGDVLQRTMPYLMKDLENVTNQWGSSGRFDPFDDLYNVVFQLTIRQFCFREIADSPEATRRIIDIFWQVEKAGTPVNLLLPWLPNDARKRKTDALKELYMMLKTCFDGRKSSTDAAQDDPIQTLIDEGVDMNQIIGFVMGSLMAATSNTGIQLVWLAVMLRLRPDWKIRVESEIQALLEKYTTEDSDKSTPYLQRFAQIPVYAWADELPTLNHCIHETIRFTLSRPVIRRVVCDDDIVFANTKVKKGDFVIYSLPSKHHSASLYPEPEKWDPSRFERGEDQQRKYAFLGWGVGLHPCLGRRFADLEIKITTALLLMQYDYSVVDKFENPITEQPKINRRDLHKLRPIDPLYIRYTRKTN